MKKNILLVFLVLNCATLAKDYMPKDYSFSTNEVDTSFYVDGEKVSETILEIPIPKVPDKTIKIRAVKTGFKPEEVELRYQFNPIVHLNGLFLIFYPVGVLVDYYNDAFYHYSAEKNYFVMQKDSNFTENDMSKSYVSYEEKRGNLKFANGYFATNRATKIFSIARFEKGEYIELANRKDSSIDNSNGILSVSQYQKNNGLDNRIGFLTPGKYRISAFFSYSVTEGRNIRTYEGKVNETTEFEVLPNALTILCTDFDQTKGKTVFQLYQSKSNPDLHKFSAPNLQNTGNQICPAIKGIDLKIN
ncbi:hypothetical protein EHQ68_12840 [Leptospira congkakensis]|uniref:PEGA domain-containing protein n=1 Tax=Leptospira congkakensis TaxID=2484932 RepID=A0A4Z1A5N5_9LEPT|nr:hypothetical protein [Leptospira congkakensis]TGL86214.1 hypothetical protein EHQ68_12840 [Leptospira congkakensis]TGL94242.1 hypothetical protein EHQ69_07190 [Leptospira congkakensis]TGL94348.1 hypothetical protein EHQ70_13600 [Leptospira congkakensis]